MLSDVQQCSAMLNNVQRGETPRKPRENPKRTPKAGKNIPKEF
jgi:hypothetical protein